MSGGATEYVMGNLGGVIASAGFNVLPTQKYYDKYPIRSSSTIVSSKAKKGNATYETKKWYSDYNELYSGSNN